jgi:hypothetical protein
MYLRRAGVSDVLKARFLPQTIIPNKVVPSASAPELSKAATEVSKDSSPEAFPIIQPMEAALYFESAKGLGDWMVLVASDAIKDLRETHKKNRTLFKIILKKIQCVIQLLADSTYR